MLPDFEIIAAMDLIGGRCVRLRQGDYTAVSTYSDHPLDIALRFEDAGIRRLHLVDLDGARQGCSTHLDVLQTIARHTNLIIDFGGGISSTELLKNVFDSGAHYATLGSIAVKNPSLLKTWVDLIGPERFFIGADVRNSQIAISGWQQSTGMDVNQFIQHIKDLGLKYFHCTDISKDGMLTGPDTDLYRQITTSHPDIDLVAGGGIRAISDLYDLAESGCSGAIVGKALYEGLISLQEIKKLLENL